MLKKLWGLEEAGEDFEVLVVDTLILGQVRFYFPPHLTMTVPIEG